MMMVDLRPPARTNFFRLLNVLDMYMYIYTYIHIYVERERETEREKFFVWLSQLKVGSVLYCIQLLNQISSSFFNAAAPFVSLK